MTPEERDLLTHFLQDLAQARANGRDAEAAAMIAQVVNTNPDAPYLLVQHCILADQALHAAQARIAQLEAQSQSQGSSSFLGGATQQSGPWGAPSGTSVPPTQPAPSYPGGYGQGPFSQGGGLGSFLRTAGTTAAGVAGGELLFSGLSGLFGGHGMFGGGGFGGFGGGFGGAPQENVEVVNNYYEDDHGHDGGGSWDDGGGYDDGSGNF